MGDRVVRADGVSLEGGRMLQEVMRPAEAHTFEVVRDASPLPSESAVPAAHPNPDPDPNPNLCSRWALT